MCRRNFGDFDEPFYRGYIADPLGPIFEAAGLKCDMKVQGSSTKSLSFLKPAVAATPSEDDMFAVKGSTAATSAATAAASVAAEANLDE